MIVLFSFILRLILQFFFLSLRAFKDKEYSVSDNATNRSPKYGPLNKNIETLYPVS